MSEPQSFRQPRFQAPPGATELILVRHGDPALSPEGREQAARVCARLAQERIDAIYVTNLRRTLETAAALAETLGIAPIVEPDLREVYLGEWEGGLFRRRVAEHHPIATRMFEEERWDVIPGAEPALEFAGRVRRGVERIASAHPDQRVAVFAHGGTIGEIFAQAARSRSWAFSSADNASVSHLVVTAERWNIRRFNDTAHLESRLTAMSEPPT